MPGAQEQAATNTNTHRGDTGLISIILLIIIAKRSFLIIAEFQTLDDGHFKPEHVVKDIVDNPK
jgi:hypothetical protein